MITYINKSNANKYRALFDKVNKEMDYLGTDSEINSIEEYFSHIQDIVAKTEDRRYTILPLDEEVFEIDANKRSITVPPSFKANGISVQGDHIAEILYFRIDRFFDATDLNEMDIYIQWENKNHKGISKEWVRDVESEPGKLIFGWPLSEEITDVSGAVKFAVRFVKFNPTDTTDVVYSFSTLTTEAQIKSALDFDLVADGIAVQRLDYDKIILDRLVNSSAPIPGAGDSSEPFITLFLDPTADLDANGIKALHVQAFSPDAGKIKYNWTFYAYALNDKGEWVMDQSPDRIGEGMELDAGVPVLTEDDIPVEGKIYYTVTFEADGVTVAKSKSLDMTIPSDRAIFDDYVAEVEGAIPVYEFVSEFVADAAGRYTVQIVNRRGQATEAKVPKNPNDEGAFIKHDLETIIPLPGKPIVEGVKDAKGDALTNVIIKDPSNPALKLEGDKEPVDSVVLYGNAKANDGDVISYQWLMGEEAIKDATNSSYEVTGSLISNLVNPIAKFKLKGFSSRNKVVLEDISQECVVSFPPVNPGIDAVTNAVMQYVGREIDGYAFIDIANPGRANDYEYEWYEFINYTDGSTGIGRKVAEGRLYTPVDEENLAVKIYSKYNNVRLNDGVLSGEIRVEKIPVVE